MNAVEYLKARDSMCNAVVCIECQFWDRVAEGPCQRTLVEAQAPERAVNIVRQWAEAQGASQLKLSAMERRFVHIYIEKGFLWAARNKDGRLRLYKRCPERAEREFTNTSASLESSRDVIAMVFPAITWENSPVCLPKLLERGTIS